MSSAPEPLALVIKQLQHRHHRALEIRLAPLGISVVQWNALREIDRHPGSSMHQLAALTFNSDQAFGTLTTRLLRLGLVERRPGGGRVTVHCLTPQGRTLLHQGRERVADFYAMAFASLREDERAVLAGLLTKVLGDTRLDDPRDEHV